MIKVTIDTKAVQSMLNAVQKQIPYTTALAINATARDAAVAANKSMASIFNRANSFTQRGVYVPTLATKGTLTAVVGIRPIQQQYLGLEILGGTRTPANNTRTTSQALTLPGSGPNPLRFGSIKSLIAQAEADKARRLAARQVMTVHTRGQARRVKTASNTGIFKLSGHGIRPSDVGGFFRRLPGHKVQRLIAFEPTAQYKPKFQFERQVLTTVNSTFAANFNLALTRALATAK